MSTMPGKIEIEGKSNTFSLRIRDKVIVASLIDSIRDGHMGGGAV